MKIYLLEYGQSGWDVYDSCAVIAENEEEAKKIHPDGCSVWKGGWMSKHYDGKLHSCGYSAWADDLDMVEVTHLGEAKEGCESGMICSSFISG